MALRVILEAPEAVPLRVPISVAVVVQVVLTTLPKTVTGTVTDAPLDLTVPFVVVPILSTLRLPLLLTTTGLWVQLLKLRALTFPLTLGPVNLAPSPSDSVVPDTVEVLHVLENTPLVDSRVAELVRVVSRVTASLGFSVPFVSRVVSAEAVLANAIRASAAKAATPRILLSFIFFLLGIRQ
jgi:hypothetical protein